MRVEISNIGRPAETGDADEDITADLDGSFFERCGTIGYWTA
ncbi:MAG: hypothetical protein R3C05_04660 [Pirellulaceae bacterium]